MVVLVFNVAKSTIVRLKPFIQRYFKLFLKNQNKPFYSISFCFRSSELGGVAMMLGFIPNRMVSLCPVGYPVFIFTDSIRWRAGESSCCQIWINNQLWIITQHYKKTFNLVYKSHGTQWCWSGIHVYSLCNDQIPIVHRSTDALQEYTAWMVICASF